MSRICDAIGCESDVASGRFMCLRHWRLVPLDVQKTINTQYWACRKDFAFLSDLVYLGAAVKAIDQIAESEGKVGRNPYRGLLIGAEKRAAEAKS